MNITITILLCVIFIVQTTFLVLFYILIRDAIKNTPSPQVFTHNEMILVKTDRNGNTIEIAKSSRYSYLVETIESMTEELETKGIFLIKKEVSPNLARNYEFSSKDKGWECALIIAHGWVNKVE